MEAMSTLPLVLDTDIGDDIDDALALALILNSPELELRGITTVFRNAPRRAALTKYLLEVWKQEKIPVHAGCSKPLLQEVDFQLGNQFQILEEAWQSDVLETPTQHAVDFLLDAANIEDEEAPETLLSLVPIGPLTNIALAFARAPELAARCRIVLMGGMWDARAENFKAEWNIACDPEAAAMVFNSGAEISMIGLDVTLQCVLRAEHIEKIKTHDSAQSRVLARLIELWMEETKIFPLLHDPLAVLTLLSNCVEFEEKNIAIELCGEKRGQMRVLGGKPNARVAVKVDVERALEEFMARILKIRACDLERVIKYSHRKFTLSPSDF
jgi:purine nucleosidase